MAAHESLQVIWQKINLRDGFLTTQEYFSHTVPFKFQASSFLRGYLQSPIKYKADPLYGTSSDAHTATLRLLS